MTAPFALGIELDGDGAHPASWRAASHSPQSLLTPERVANTARAAERSGFTFATFEDSPLVPGSFPDITGRLDAVQRAAFASQLSSSLGLVPVVNAFYTEPFHIATQLASLDYSSQGRAGWLIGLENSDDAAAAYGRETVADGVDGFQEVTDVVETLRRLWDSWEDDAVIRDVSTGRYVDRAKLHYATFTGANFSVVGPSIIPRPPQGQVVVFSSEGAADSDGIDVLLLASDRPARTPDEIVAGIATSAERLRGTVPRIIAQLEVVLDNAGVRATDRLHALDASGPTPWLSTERPRFIGTAPELVELLSNISRVVDGVRLVPAVLDIDLPEIGRAVLPELRRREIFASPQAGSTLRQSLGLARPTNRFVGVRS